MVNKVYLSNQPVSVPPGYYLICQDVAPTNKSFYSPDRYATLYPIVSQVVGTLLNGTLLGTFVLPTPYGTAESFSWNYRPDGEILSAHPISLEQYQALRLLYRPPK